MRLRLFLPFLGIFLVGCATKNYRVCLMNTNNDIYCAQHPETHHDALVGKRYADSLVDGYVYVEKIPKGPAKTPAPHVPQIKAEKGNII